MKLRISLALYALSALVADVQAHGMRGRLLQTEVQEKKPDEEPEGFKDSELIKGPDCGHVKQIIGVYTKAARVGELAGKASGAITNVNSAVAVVDAALVKIDEIAEQTGSEFKAVTEPLKKASEDATSAQVKLETKLEAVKDSISGSDTGGASASDDDVAKLNKLTKAANEKADIARSFTDTALKKADKIKKESMKDAGKMEKMIAHFVEKAEPVVKECADIEQKANWAIEAADKIVSKADDASAKLDKKIEGAEEQAPVVQAQKDNLESAKEGVTKASDELKSKIDELKTAAEALEGDVKSLKEAAETNAGKPEMKDEAGNLDKAETQMRDTQTALAAVKAEAKTVMKRQKDLEDKIDKV